MPAPPPDPSAPDARRAAAPADGAGRPDPSESNVARVLDLFEEHVYSGEIRPDGHYDDHASGPTLERYLGGALPAGVALGEVWESRIHADDWPAYAAFNAALLRGEDAEVTYRLAGFDGVTRVLWDRARPRTDPAAGVLVDGIISDVTARTEAAARLAEASDRFTQLLDVVGEHVYLAVAYPDGAVEELFQGPGGDRLLGGAEADDAMENWDAAIPPEDRPAYAAFNLALSRGEDAEVEYRLHGADGVTRWVHDRARTRPRPDGTVEVSGIVSDITERRRMRIELADAHAALSRVVESMDEHLYTLRVDPDGVRAVYRGPNREALFGGPLPAGDAADRLWEELLHPEDREIYAAAVGRLAAGEPIELEYRLIGLDGGERMVSDRLRPRRDADGTLFFDGITRDITERRRLEDELRRSVVETREAHREVERARAEAEQRARTDELTGTYNRRHFAEMVSGALAAGAGDCGLLLVDVDHFKHVNDAYGHGVGDAVLVAIAGRLAASLRPGDCLARWGGEEFAVLLRGVGSEAELAERGEEVRALVARDPIAVGSVVLRLTVSVGTAVATAARADLDALVDAADACLYGAKRAGRNRVALVPAVDAAAVPGGEPEAVGMARALVFAAGMREGAPEAHSAAVADLAARTAERLGLSVGDVLRCRLAGWLHDVGKLSVPEPILGKPGPLDEEEWAVIRGHAAAGEAIVRRVPVLATAAAGVRHHHERVDGRGYPDRLAGDAIPLDARIVAAADAYAAMTADRPYAAARTPADAAAELRRSAGSHLDPVVVEALLDVLGLAPAALPLAA